MCNLCTNYGTTCVQTMVQPVYKLWYNLCTNYGTTYVQTMVCWDYQNPSQNFTSDRIYMWIIIQVSKSINPWHSDHNNCAIVTCLLCVHYPTIIVIYTNCNIFASYTNITAICATCVHNMVQPVYTIWYNLCTNYGVLRLSKSKANTFHPIWIPRS